jgi:hypothetical protein
LEVRERKDGTHRIPPHCGLKPRRPAVRVAPVDDVVEDFGMGIKSGIHESDLER